MKLSGLLMAGALLLGQLSPTKPEMEESMLQVMAFSAQEVDGYTGTPDEQLKPYKVILKALEPLNKFDVIKTDIVPAIHSEATTVPINALYWAEVTIQNVDEQGLISADVSIMYDGGNGPIIALRNTVQAQPNRAFTFRGMELGIGELVVVLSFPKEGEQGEGSDSDGEENQQEQEEQEQGKDKVNEDQQDFSESEQNESEQEEEESPKLNQEEESEQEKADADEDSEEEMQDGKSTTSEEGDPKDDQTIQAILESLEEMDKEEQENAHHRRSEVKFKSKGWW